MSPASSKPDSRRSKRRRLIVLLLAGFLLVGPVSGYRYFWLHHPIGHGPAGPPVPRELFQQAWSQRRVLLVGLGDSITEGYGAIPHSLSYFNRLVENPQGEFPEMRGICLSGVLPNLEVKNLSLSGTTSIENLQILVPKLELQSPDTFGVVVLTTGGNDVIHNYGRTPPREGAMYGASLSQARPWIENFHERLDDTIDAIEAKFPGGCRIFLANLYDPTDGVGDAANAGLPSWPDGLEVIAAYNEAIAGCAQRHDSVHLVDVHGEFLGHGIHSLQFWRANYDAEDPHYWYWANLKDPNNRGYDAIRRLFLIEMVKVLPGVLQDVSKP